MTIAPVPANESERLKVLYECSILDTLPEPGFDDLTSLASAIFDVPIALVTLVDIERQWFKSAVGLSVSQTPRAFSFCAHVIAEQKPIVIHNALEDLRTFNNPLVTGSPFIRFYAGIPLITHDGFGLGAFCIIDSKPREFNQVQVDVLAKLASQVVKQLEFRRSSRRLTKAMAQSQARESLMSRLIQETHDNIQILDLDGNILETRDDGISTDTIKGSPWCDQWKDRSHDVAVKALDRAKETGAERFFVQTPERLGTDQWTEVSITLIHDNAGQPLQLLVISRDVNEEERRQLSA
jgi:hypothetical protein